jgi:hypothetical protein
MSLLPCLKAAAFCSCFHATRSFNKLSNPPNGASRMRTSDMNQTALAGIKIRLRRMALLKPGLKAAVVPA